MGVEAVTLIFGSAASLAIVTPVGVGLSALFVMLVASGVIVLVAGDRGRASAIWPAACQVAAARFSYIVGVFGFLVFVIAVIRRTLVSQQIRHYSHGGSEIASITIVKELPQRPSAPKSGN